MIRAFAIGPDASQVGVVVFSEQVFLAFPLNAYDNREDISQAILSLNYLGQTTNTPQALIETRTQCFNPSNGDRRDASNLAIIVTDGLPFPDNRRQPAIEEAKALRDAGAVMVSVGITNVIDEAFLKEMSSPPQALGTNYFTATDFQALESIRRRVVEGTCESVEGMFIFPFIILVFMTCKFFVLFKQVHFWVKPFKFFVRCLLLRLSCDLW